MTRTGRILTTITALLVSAVVPAALAVAGDASVPKTGSSSAYRPVNVPKRAEAYYELNRGVDNLRVRRTASGNLLRFSFRVVKPEIAQVLGDKNAIPYLIGQRTHALLEIPVMDKIGQLRQTGQLEAGQEYWMVFSNKGNVIKAGDRVSILVGTYRIDGLVVE
jgi:hypothetical protein